MFNAWVVGSIPTGVGRIKVIFFKFLRVELPVR